MGALTPGLGCDGSRRADARGHRSLALGSAASFLTLAFSIMGCSLGNGEAEERRSTEPKPRRSVAGVELYPVPLPVVRACRSAQQRSRAPILCPSVLPRAVHDSAGSAALPRPPLAPLVIPSRRHTGSIAGLNFGYSGETGDPRKDHPERFLHFEALRQEEPLPPAVRPAKLGGRSGLLAPASSRSYRSETYWTNHLRFFWSERGVKYAATLHDFGADTMRVLDALVAGLRPADRLRPPAGASEGRRIKTIAVPIRGPVSLVAGLGGQVWVAGQGDTGSFASPGESHRPSIVRIDQGSRRIAGKPVQIHFGADAVAIANGEALIWVALHAPESRPLRLLDPGSARFVGSVAERAEAVAVAVGPDAVWVADFGGRPGSRRQRGRLLKLAPTDARRFAASIPVGRAPAGIAVGSDAVWVTNELDDTVTKIDPRTNRAVATVRVGDGPIGLTAAAGAIWVANHGAGTVSRIDPRTNRVVATIRAGRGPRGVASDRDGIWVTNELDDSVSRIDPARNKVVETIPVGSGPAGIVAGEGAVWVANRLDQTVTRIER